MARKVPLRKFKVMLHGKNLLLKMEKVEKHGVYIVRFVEAADAVSAVQTALEVFWSEPKGKGLREQLLNGPDDQPIFEAEEVSEVESFRPGEKPIGLIFYPEAGDHGDA